MPSKQHGIGAFTFCVRPPKERPNIFGVKSILQIQAIPFKNMIGIQRGALVAFIFLPRRTDRFEKEVNTSPRVGRGL